MIQKVLFLGFLQLIFKAELYIEQPENLKNLFSFDNKVGHIKYSVSTFGNMYYEQETELKLLHPGSDNINGCNQFPPLQQKGKERIVYLVKRGVCTYSKKAFLAQQSGAFTVLVYHDKLKIDVENIIPVQDSTCNLKRQ